MPRSVADSALERLGGGRLNEGRNAAANQETP